jgi:hypothetical protein
MTLRPAIVSALALGSVLTAALVPRFSLEDLVDRSEAVIEAKVVRSWCSWSASHKYIWTNYEIRVSDSLLGPAARTMVVSEPGGSLDGRNMQVSGAVSYAAGEHVVLFLHRTPGGYWRTSGGGQGKFTVQASGRLTPATGGIELVAPPAGLTQRGATPLASLQNLNLSQFKARVRRALSSRQAGGTER